MGLTWYDQSETQINDKSAWRATLKFTKEIVLISLMTLGVVRTVHTQIKKLVHRRSSRMGFQRNSVLAVGGRTQRLTPSI
jgi:hypothetical protein